MKSEWKIRNIEFLLLDTKKEYLLQLSTINNK